MSLREAPLGRCEILGILLKYRDIDLVLKEKLQNGGADFFYFQKTFCLVFLVFFQIFASLVGSCCTTVNTKRRNTYSYGYPCFISFLKPFRELIIIVVLGKGRGEVEVGGLEMITLHLRSKKTSLSCNYQPQTVTCSSKLLYQYGRMNGLFHSLPKQEYGIINPQALGYCSSLQRALSCLVIFSNVAT